jgi:hypothetical protein
MRCMRLGGSIGGICRVLNRRDNYLFGFLTTGCSTKHVAHLVRIRYVGVAWAYRLAVAAGVIASPILLCERSGDIRTSGMPGR